jgi:transcriptional regulator with XRE-family HTH domain
MTQDIIQNLIGEKIRKAREEIGLTQDELGNEIHLSRVSINAIENGHRKQINYESIRKIAHALNKPEKYFFGDEAEIQYLIPELKFSVNKMSKLPPEKQELLIPFINSIMNIVSA